MDIIIIIIIGEEEEYDEEEEEKEIFVVVVVVVVHRDSDDEKKTKSEENSLARVGIETRMKNASVGALAALTLSLGGNPTMMMMTPSTSVAYASTGNGIENTAKRTGDCLLQNCKAELAGCLADEKCVESLACLNVCFGKPDEADCQI